MSAALVALVTVVALVVSFTFDLSGRPAPGATLQVVGGHPLIGKPAPDFTLHSLDGATVHLADLRGRPVIVNFWASYCGPCKIEFPLFRAARSAHAPQGLEIVGVTRGDDDLEAARAFAAAQDAAWPLAEDPGNVTAQAYGAAEAVPVSFYVDRTGIVRAVSFGPPASGVLDDQLAKIL